MPREIPLAPRWQGGKSSEVQDLHQELIRGSVDNYAPCLRKPEIYVDYDEGHTPSEAAARDMCYGCPVLKLCLSYAEASGATHGVWGGKVFTDGS